MQNPGIKNGISMSNKHILNYPCIDFKHTMAPQTLFELISSTASNGQIVDGNTGLIIRMLVFGGIIFIDIVIMTFARRS